MNKDLKRRPSLLATLLSSLTAFLASCTSTPAPTPPLAALGVKPGPATAPEATATSGATSPLSYRRDAASHLYKLNSARIFKGMLPPQLYAIGVLQVEVDGQGQVSSTHWMRAPSHAPEVIAEIERTVRQAAPYPAPVRLGRVTYTDTWLWHSSGRFQLDTLTEGQL
ncbi:MAG: protein TonB [Rhodoferax sp.]|jgi:protein TonB